MVFPHPHLHPHYKLLEKRHITYIRFIGCVYTVPLYLCRICKEKTYSNILCLVPIHTSHLQAMTTCNVFVTFQHAFQRQSTTTPVLLHLCHNFLLTEPKEFNKSSTSCHAPAAGLPTQHQSHKDVWTRTIAPPHLA